MGTVDVDAGPQTDGGLVVVDPHSNYYLTGSHKEEKKKNQLLLFAWIYVYFRVLFCCGLSFEYHETWSERNANMCVSTRFADYVSMGVCNGIGICIFICMIMMYRIMYGII